jgi:nucleotide-binding universal stress UspA family protein
MSATLNAPPTPLALVTPQQFEKIVVGVDDSEHALEATRQATELLSPHGLLTLLAAYQFSPTVISWGFSSYAYLDPKLREELQENAQATVRKAAEAARALGVPELVEGKTQSEIAAKALVDEAARQGADLVAVGAPPHGRAWGIISGDCATTVLHKALCSVLFARAPVTGGLKLVTVGIDGSKESEKAFQVAKALAERAGAKLTVLAAYGGFALDLEAVEAIDPDYTSSANDVVTALVGYAGQSDLLIVGSRGLHGLRALGSVSERVAHEASCSVLVVR